MCDKKILRLKQQRGEELEKERLWAVCFTAEEDIWFVSYWYNLLCKFDISKRELECIPLPVKNIIEGLYIGILKVGNIICLVPANADSVCMYNIKTHEFKTFMLRERTKNIDKFIACAVYGECVFMFPYHYPYILKFNLETCEAEYLDFRYKGELIQVGLQSCTCGKNVYLTVQGSNAIAIYNMQNETYEYKEIGDKKEWYSSVLRTEEDELWMTNQRGDIRIYDLRTCKTELIKIRDIKFDVDVQSVSPCFVGNAEYADFVYFFPGKAGMILKVNKKTRQAEKAEFGDTLCQEADNCFGWMGSRFSMPQGKSILYIFNIINRYFYSINLQSENVEKYEIESDHLNEKELKSLFLQYETIMQEGYLRGVYMEKGTRYLGIEHFIKMIENFPAGDRQQKENIGEMIFGQ